ncbi:MAG: hypothetical protein R3B99_26810 [Polyangiales bacterium]
MTPRSFAPEGRRSRGAAAQFARLAVLVLPRVGQAQAWIRDPGHTYAQLSYRLIRADKLYSPSGDVVDIRPYRQHALGFYGEVGVVDRWLMVNLSGDLLRRQVLVDQGATTGLGDFRVGLWSGLLEAPFRLALGVEVGLPTGDPTPDAGSNDPAVQTVADVLPTGDGEVDVHVRLAAGHGFGYRRTQQYVTGDVGYWVRTTPRDAPASIGGDAADIRDQLSFRLETGWKIDRPGFDRFWLVTRVAGILIVQDRGADGASVARFAGLGDGVEYVSFGVELAAHLGAGVNLSFGMDGAFYAQNVPAAPQWKLGLSWER